MLDLWDPWQEFDRLRGEVDRLFGRYAEAARGGQDVALRPMSRVREDVDRYVLSVDLPGVREGDIDVEAQGQRLRLSATRHLDGDEREVRYERLFVLPDGADGGRIEARLADGVLVLEIPKRDEVKPRRVEIAAGGGERLATIEAGEVREPAAVGAPD